VISHNHYDHLDLGSVKTLHQRFPNLQWYVPRGLKSWMLKRGIPNEQVDEQDWWSEKKFQPSSQREGVKFVFLPAQHW
jgi:L-ascorbate metabolism protein UlaG (beta-lactamase superfamily)